MADPPLENVHPPVNLPIVDRPLEKNSTQLFFEKVKVGFGVDVDIADYFAFIETHDPNKNRYLNIFASDGKHRYLVNTPVNTPRENLLALAVMARANGINQIGESILSQLEEDQAFSNFTVASIGGIWGEVQSAFGTHSVSVNPCMDQIEEKIGKPREYSHISRINAKLTPDNVEDVEVQIGQKPDIELSAGLFEFGSGLEDANGISNSQESYFGHAQALLDLLKPGGFLIVKGENDILEKVFFKSKPQMPVDFSIIFNADDQTNKHNQSRTKYLVIQKK